MPQYIIRTYQYDNEEKNMCVEKSTSIIAHSIRQAYKNLQLRIPYTAEIETKESGRWWGGIINKNLTENPQQDVHGYWIIWRV